MSSDNQETPSLDKKRKKKRKSEITTSQTELPCPSIVDSNGLVKLNVGGKRFITRYATLTRNGLQENFFIPLLSGRFPVEKDEKGYIFIDRNGAYFEPVLDYLRSGELHCPQKLSYKRLIQEAYFYGVRLDDSFGKFAKNDENAPLTDESLKELLISYRTSSLERNYKENREGLKLVEEAVFRGFRSEAAKGKQLVVRFWPSTDIIASRCKQKWGEVIVIHPLPQFMVNDAAHVFDNALYEVCKKGKDGLCWHLTKKHRLTVDATDNSDYLTTHTYVDRNNVISINTYAWCVVATTITPHVYHAAEAVSILWSPKDPDAANLLQNPPSVSKPAAKPFNPG